MRGEDRGVGSKSTFGNSKKLNVIQEDEKPGPGSYEYKNYVGDLPKFEQPIVVDKKRKSVIANWYDFILVFYINLFDNV